MPPIRKLRLRFRSLFHRSLVEKDLEDELHDYLEREIEREMASGTPPEEAKRLVLAGLNGKERLKEECRDARGVRWLEDALSDIRFTWRTFRKAPAFTLTVIAALAFCIGTNTAVFSVVDTVLFRPLPFPDQNRLVAVTEGVPKLGFPVLPFSAPDYLFVAANNRSFAATAVYRTQSYEVSGAGQPRRIYGARVTPSLFQVLEISPLVGRAFTEEEDALSKRFAVLTYGFAESTFGMPARALGRTILLDRTPYTVIGVTPQSFSFPIRGSRFGSHPADVFIPVSWSNKDRQQIVSNFDYSMIARLKANVSMEGARADVRSLVKRIEQDYPPEIKRAFRQMPNFSLASQIVPYREEFTGNIQRPLMLLLAAVGVVLLIGCADVTNLMLSRMVGRQREFALKTALGAGRWRLARQTITEGLVLSISGGVIGFCLAFGTLPLLVRFAPDNLPRLGEIGLNWRMAAFVTTVTLATPLLFCLGPLVSTLRSNVVGWLNSEGRTSTHGKYRRAIMSGAVVTQFALTFVLLAVAGLLARSLLLAAEANPGFRPEHVMSVRLTLPHAAYNTRVRITEFFDRLLARLKTFPSVRQAGILSDLPMGSTANVIISIKDRGRHTERVDTVFCRGNALEALRVSLLKGRLLGPEDQLGKPHATVISQALAKRVWPQEDPIGKHIRFGVDVPMNDDPWLTVVGVVEDVKAHLNSNSPRLLLFTSWPDWVNELYLVVQTSGDPIVLKNAIRREINRLDPNLPIGRVEKLDQVLGESLSTERFGTWLLISFATAALLLATLGIAGLLAYHAAQRKQEFGVRIALGANRRDLMRLVLGYSLRLSGCGIAIGFAVSMAVTRALTALLYNTSAADPGTFLAVPLILLGVALAAALLPAWRVARTDPITALRAE